MPVSWLDRLKMKEEQKWVRTEANHQVGVVNLLRLKISPTTFIQLKMK